MKKTPSCILVLLLALVAFSCEDKNENDEFSIELDKTSITLDINGTEQSVTLKVKGEWYTSGVPEWLSMTPNADNHSTDITFVATENKELARREASIVFNRGNVTKTLIVRQLGLSDLDPFIELNKSELTISVTGDQQKIELTTNTAWKLTEVADWVTIDKTSGNKSAQITISFLKNDAPEGRQTSFLVSSEDGSIKKRVNISQKGLKDYISGPYLPIFRFKQVKYTTELTHYDLVANSLFINRKIKDKIYLGNLVSHNAKSNTDIPEFTGYTFNPITVSTSAPIDGEVLKTYIPSWAEQDNFAKQIIAKKPKPNSNFTIDNSTVNFYTYKQLHTIGIANLGEKLDEVVSGASYIDKEMTSGHGFIFSFKETLFILDVNIPGKLIKEELKEEDIAKGVSYVSVVTYGRIGLLIVESHSLKVKDAINKHLENSPLSQEETNLIQSANVTYVYYDNDKRLRTHTGNLDAVNEYKKAILNRETGNIYPLEFYLSTYPNNSPSDITFSFDVPKK